MRLFGAFKRTNRRTDAFKEVLADLKKHPVSLIYAHLGCFPWNGAKKVEAPSILNRAGQSSHLLQCVMLRMIRICRNYWTLDTSTLVVQSCLDWVFELVEQSHWFERTSCNKFKFTKKYFENKIIWDFRHEAWLWLNCNNREQREKVNSFSETVVFEITSLLRRWPPALLDKFSTKFHSSSDPVEIHP